MTDALFREVFRDWQERAGVFSAQPNAPVVPDTPRRNPFADWARMLRERLGRPRYTPASCKPAR